MIFYLMHLRIIFLGIIFPVKILFNIILEIGVCMGEVGNGFTLHALLLEFIHSRKSDFSDYVICIRDSKETIKVFIRSDPRFSGRLACKRLHNLFAYIHLFFSPRGRI